MVGPQPPNSPLRLLRPKFRLATKHLFGPATRATKATTAKRWALAENFGHLEVSNMGRCTGKRTAAVRGSRIAGFGGLYFVRFSVCVFISGERSKLSGR